MASPSPENGGFARNFPTDPTEFDRDPRISYSKLDQKYILETEDGQEFEYDSAIKRWVHQVWLCAPFCTLRFSARTARAPRCLICLSLGMDIDVAWSQVDEELLRQQQEAYKVAGVDDEEELHPRDRKKRKQQASGDDVRTTALVLCPSSQD